MFEMNYDLLHKVETQEKRARAAHSQRVEEARNAKKQERDTRTNHNQ